MTVSVVVCTFNRAASLARTLESLCRQAEIGRGGIEVLVVDNNSRDNTRAVAERFGARLPLRYIWEERQGLACARNRGVAESRGDVILFTDDDVCLDDAWLSAYLAAFGRYPEAGYFGGRILPDWRDMAKPAWLRDEHMSLLSGVLLSFDFGTETRPYREGEIGPVGASFAVRRRLFDEIGGFRTDLGVVGTTRGRGEDTEYIARARAGGEWGVYVGEALSWHEVHPSRLTLGALYRHGVAKGRAHGVLTGDATPGSALKAGGFLIRGLYQLGKGHGDRFRQCVINAGLEMGKKRPGKAALP